MTERQPQNLAMCRQPKRDQGTDRWAVQWKRICQPWVEDVKILHQARCEVNGKWTPSHMNIRSNECADTITKNGQAKEPCVWSRTTLTACSVHDAIPSSIGDVGEVRPVVLRVLVEILFPSHLRSLGGPGETFREEDKQIFCIRKATTTNGEKPR